MATTKHETLLMHTSELMRVSAHLVARSRPAWLSILIVRSNDFAIEVNALSVGDARALIGSVDVDIDAALLTVGVVRVLRMAIVLHGLRALTREKSDGLRVLPGHASFAAFTLQGHGHMVLAAVGHGAIASVAVRICIGKSSQTSELARVHGDLTVVSLAFH